jgi:hypothetical protein
LSNLHILVPLTALGIVLAFRQWYFRRFGGLFVAVLVTTELFLLVIWEATTQGDVTFEVWVGERAQSDVTP